MSDKKENPIAESLKDSGFFVYRVGNYDLTDDEIERMLDVIVENIDAGKTQLTLALTEFRQSIEA